MENKLQRKPLINKLTNAPLTGEFLQRTGNDVSDFMYLHKILEYKATPNFPMRKSEQIYLTKWNISISSEGCEKMK
jgi:hypothetical protein